MVGQWQEDQVGRYSYDRFFLANQYLGRIDCDASLSILIGRFVGRYLRSTLFLELNLSVFIDCDDSLSMDRFRDVAVHR